MAKLSIVIPVYNTEETFLNECLNSVFNSTIKDIELILVDDGSTKDYSNLVKSYGKKINYFKTENQGTLKARLFGISKSTSPYVCFVDSDDTISFCYLEALLAKITEENADVCFNDWAFQTEQTKYVCMNDTTIKKDICYTDGTPLKKFFMQAGREHSYYVLWNKIFKKEILDRVCDEINKLPIDKLVFAEDVIITYFAFKHSSKVVNVHIGYYFYRIHGAQQISVVSEDKLKNHIESMTMIFDTMEQDLKTISKFEEMQVYFYMWKNLLCSTNYQVARRAKYKKLIPIIKEKYNIAKVKRLPHGYGKAYEHQRVLPVNIDEIDSQLKKVYYSNKYLKIYVKPNSYAFITLVNMKHVFNRKFNLVKRKKHANFIFKKEKVSLKQRILHNDIVYKIGVALFPKGSKMRKFLKSKL